ncbi:MAG: PEGA domain-containing protein, partial [Deltaproteobacteria bacterium]
MKSPVIKNVGGMALIWAWLAPAVVIAAPEAMTRQQIIDLAKPAVGYSYWWGHGCWRTDGTQHGSCSGSCPDCTHSGSYGADCSGFVAKVWQVPSSSAVTTDSHPYSTREFRYSETHWDQIPRDQAQIADAFVYRNSSNTAGHIVLYESGDPWGSIWTYEARGCSYGIVHNLRTLSSSYVAIRRHNLSEQPANGRLIGAVYEDQGNGDMSIRIPGATVQVQGGPSTTARDPDAIWQFDLAPGDYTVTASAQGYEPASRTCTVTAGQDTWCSIGLRKSCVPDCTGRQCGPDPVCGTSCGECPAGHQCDGQGICQCQPDCTGRQCGPDPVCGTSCGDCPAGHECDGQGTCQCRPDCTGRQCGPDPVCGTSCGECPAGHECDGQGICQCRPDCSGLECGPDPVCGAPCGECGPGMVCQSGSCRRDPDCRADCVERECGPDPACGLSCGICPPELYCSAAGMCAEIPDDAGKLYGYVAVAARDPDGNTRQTGELQPWAQVNVTDTGAETVADENGYYEILVSAGKHRLVASAEGMEPGEEACEAEAGAATECRLVVYRQVDELPPDQIGGG